MRRGISFLFALLLASSLLGSYSPTQGQEEKVEENTCAPILLKIQEARVAFKLPRPPTFYRDWAYQKVNEILCERFELSLLPMDAKEPLPPLYETPQKLLNALFDCIENKEKSGRKVQSAFITEEERLEIHFAKERVIDTEALMIHEQAHYLFAAYGGWLIGTRHLYEEEIADQTAAAFKKEVYTNLSLSPLP